MEIEKLKKQIKNISNEIQNERKISNIIIHHTSGNPISSKKAFILYNENHKIRFGENHKGENGIYLAYHYIIGKDGDITKGRLEKNIGWHAGNREINKNSIGITLTGNFELYPPTEEQYNSLNILLNNLNEKYYKINNKNLKIKGHKQISQTLCPGKYFDFNKLKINNMSKTENILKDESNLKLQIEKLNITSILTMCSAQWNNINDPEIKNYLSTLAGLCRSKLKDIEKLENE